MYLVNVAYLYIMLSPKYCNSLGPRAGTWPPLSWSRLETLPCVILTTTTDSLGPRPAFLSSRFNGLSFSSYCIFPFFFIFHLNLPLFNFPPCSIPSVHPLTIRFLPDRPDYLEDCIRQPALPGLHSSLLPSLSLLDFFPSLWLWSGPERVVRGYFDKPRKKGWAVVVLFSFSRPVFGHPDTRTLQHQPFRRHNIP